MATSKFFGDYLDPSVECTIIAGSFAPNGSSAIAASGVEGIGVTVARTTTGVFTVTLASTYSSMVCANLTLALATASSAASDNRLELGAIDVASAKTIVIRNIKAVHIDHSTPASSVALTCAAADIAANAANRIHFMFLLRK